MKENIYFRSMHIYTLQRSNEIDHVNGRPAILLWFKQNKSLIWARTTKKDNKTKEVPLSITLNKNKFYFYSTGVEKIENKFIKSVWIDFETYSVYKLRSYEQQKLISKDDKWYCKKHLDSMRYKSNNEAIKKIKDFLNE